MSLDYQMNPFLAEYTPVTATLSAWIDNSCLPGVTDHWGLCRTRVYTSEIHSHSQATPENPLASAS